ncbi:Hypothetical predicted protein, partial [Marmota monax]
MLIHRALGSGEAALERALICACAAQPRVLDNSQPACRPNAIVPRVRDGVSGLCTLPTLFSTPTGRQRSVFGVFEWHTDFLIGRAEGSPPLCGWRRGLPDS